MSDFISRGFGGHRRVPEDLADRVPPGQYVEDGFPVLTVGPTPVLDTAEWSIRVDGAVGEQRDWSWDELLALPQEEIPCDIHCVTKWSKLGTSFGGVSVDALLGEAAPTGGFAMAHSYGGYTTNHRLDDLTGGKAWIATEHEGEPLPAEHGGPARLLVPHLYFWKSAKWVQRLQITDSDSPGFWEENGYHNRGDPFKEERYWND